jgi:hypothetical protein
MLKTPFYCNRSMEPVADQWFSYIIGYKSKDPSKPYKEEACSSAGS